MLGAKTTANRALTQRAAKEARAKRQRRASQFSRYLLEKTGIPDRDKNARLNPVKFIKYSRFRAFLAPFKKRELRSPSGGEWRGAALPHPTPKKLASP